MRPLIATCVAALSVLAVTSAKPAVAAPPVATFSPGYDARLAEAHLSQASVHRRYHRRYRYYGARTYPYEGYRPYAYRPYYYRPYYSYGPFFPFFGFGFGW